MAEAPAAGNKEAVSELKQKLRVLKEGYAQLQAECKRARSDADDWEAAYKKLVQQREELNQLKQGGDAIVDVKDLMAQLELANSDRAHLNKEVAYLKERLHEIEVAEEKFDFAKFAQQVEIQWLKTPMVFPEHISFRATRGTFVCCQVTLKARMICDRKKVGVWETFKTEPRGPNIFGFIAHTGKYVTMEGQCLGVHKAVGGLIGKQAPQESTQSFRIVKGPYADGSDAIYIQCMANPKLFWTVGENPMITDLCLTERTEDEKDNAEWRRFRFAYSHHLPK